MGNEVVPFGKYKGKPIEVMQQDKAYCEWLAAQSWFRSHFSGIHTLVVNNFGKPTDTPDHNELQARFTDNDFVRRFVIGYRGGRDLLLQKFEEWKTGRINRHNKSIAQYAERTSVTERPKYFSDEMWASHIAHVEQTNNSAIARETAELEKITSIERPLFVLEDVQFELSGVDVCIRCRFDPSFIHVWELKIECKPSLGDDYPSVLRQMKRHGSGILFIGDGGYSGTGATIEQVRKIFRTANINILLSSDL